jgi:Putative transposase/Transposase zinc-binding domain
VVRPPLEVADIFAAHADAFLKARGGAVSPAHRRILRDLVACRTAELGGHVDLCGRCGYEQVSYNSCRNRHCPKCQASARAEWLDARALDLLPVEYFHVVFTVPPAIADLALQNKRVLYDILLRAAAETLLQIAADPRHLGAKIGFLSVLHTWGQTLQHHPHVHCVVPGGGVSPDGSRWIACRPGFFLPVKVLSRVFRGKFLDFTRQAFARGELLFHGRLAHLDDPAHFAAYLRSSYAADWVVYAKPPFGGPQQVLKYLARYTHRVAISSHRLLSLRDGKVSFRYKDYAHGARQRTMTVDAVEFIRRFLLHSLPKGFVRIRHYGLLANASRAVQLTRCRELLACPAQPAAAKTTVDAEAQADPGAARICPACGQGCLIRIRLSPRRAPLVPLRQPQFVDTS